MRQSGEKKRRDRRQAAQLITMISQFAINMLVPIFICFFAGRFIDKQFDTAVWSIILFFVGALAGFTNVYKLARKYFKNADER